MDTYFMSDFGEYQSRAIKTAIYPNRGANLMYPALGLAGESGEVCEKLKKLHRDNDGVLSVEIAESIKLELGDVLYYLCSLATELGYDLSEVALANLDKIESRMERGKIKGNGDSR